MGVLLNEPALRFFLESEAGPVGRDLIIRSRAVVVEAKRNAGVKGPETLGIETSDLYDSIGYNIELTPAGLISKIGSPSEHRGFRYPTFWDQHGHPWLTNALRDGFRA